MTKRKKIHSNDRISQMGRQLYMLRQIEGLTIEELAEQLDVSSRMIYNYETGSNAISVEVLVKMYERKVFKDRSLKELVDIFIIQIYE
ncbi:helix-turn-helix transcriptional regulator [Enterococcus avium]|uniref:helix-turn-helix domain-containing protein n=1 Tax=Enterococcus TaxID=1350 RepID=UPI00211B09C1|nr:MULTISPECIES: helix-turn-helix transcriptional regulator [Enterococcus]